MKFSYDRHFTFNVMEEEWEAYLLTNEELKELDEEITEDPSFEGEDNIPAMMIPKKKCLFITEGNATKNIIAHELFHIMVEYFYMESANLEIDQFEEVIAQFLENRLDYFVTKRDFLYAAFKKLEEAGK